MARFAKKQKKGGQQTDTLDKAKTLGKFKAKKRKGNFTKSTTKHVHGNKSGQAIKKSGVLSKRQGSEATKSQGKQNEMIKGAQTKPDKKIKDVLISKLMSIYESLRRSDVSKAEKKKLIDDVLKLTKQKQSQVAYKHNSVRVIEMCVKYGSPEQRAEVWNIFSDFFEDIMKSKYGRFLLQKMIKHGTKDQRASLIKKIKGKILRLLKHKEGGRVVEDIFSQYADAKQKSNMVEEFYGPEFAILKASFGSDLIDVFAAAPDRKKYILNFLKDALERLAQKEAVTYSIFHRPALEYFNHVDKDAQQALLDIMRDKVVNILHTEEGSKLAMQCIWSASTKDRKKIVKSFKTYVPKICKEPFGHMVSFALFDVVDDTVLVEKTIFPEIISHLDELITDQYGRRVILYLLAPRDKNYFSPSTISYLKYGDNNEISKKDSKVRADELRKGILLSVVKYLKSNVSVALKDKQLCQMLIETMKNLEDNDTCKELMIEVCQEAAQEFIPEEDSASENEHVIASPCGHWVLKQLLQQDKQRVEMGYTNLLSMLLISILPEDSLKKWIKINRGAFVVARLVEIGIEPVVLYVKEKLENVLDFNDTSDKKGIEALKKVLKNDSNLDQLSKFRQ